MIFRPEKKDLKIVFYGMRNVFYLVGILLLVPITVAIGAQEFDMIPAFLTGASIAFILGVLCAIFFHEKEEMRLKHAVVMAALIWIIAPLIASVPLWLSGFFSSPLDASFEGVSGFTGTGLTLALDIDHMPYSMNFLRHFLQFIGDGVGIIVISLSILGKTEISSVLAFKGEAKETGIRPSIIRTSRIIIGIAVAFLVIGTAMFAIAGIAEGQEAGRAVYDAVNHSMTAYATGGFSTHSQNLLYYNSPVYEIVAVILMIFGALNFNLHYAILCGKRKEAIKNTEIRVFLIIFSIGAFLIGASLLSAGLYTSADTIFRKGIFHLISAQTTTGFQTVPTNHLMVFWPAFSILLLSMVMVMGGCANSTSGGIKMLRVGILMKAVVREVKKALLPSSAVVTEKIHHLEPTPVTDTIVRGAAVIALSYLFLFAFGTMVTVAHGYSVEASAFESASALGNVGLSTGVTAPSMPNTLKAAYIFLMWAGRLEVIAILVLIGFAIAAVVGGPIK
ncbi:MAG: TrkH family potassium uptake protein [Candidatus Hadarchaeales archaeon]